jgi:hypothetical protein
MRRKYHLNTQLQKTLLKYRLVIISVGQPAYQCCLTRFYAVSCLTFLFETEIPEVHSECDGNDLKICSPELSSNVTQTSEKYL